jgi:hypothetical protein
VDRALVCWPRGKRASVRGHLVAASGRRGPTDTLRIWVSAEVGIRILFSCVVTPCCLQVLPALRSCKDGDSAVLVTALHAAQWRSTV